MAFSQNSWRFMVQNYFIPPWYKNQFRVHFDYPNFSFLILLQIYFSVYEIFVSINQAYRQRVKFNSTELFQHPLSPLSTWNIVCSICHWQSFLLAFCTLLVACILRAYQASGSVNVNQSYSNWQPLTSFVSSATKHVTS